MKSKTTVTTILSSLVIACTMVVISAPPVAAQTAKKLNCKGCVKSKQLRNNGIKSKDIRDGAVTTSKIATPTGAAGVNSANVGPVTDDQTVNSITVAIPGPGVVIVNASGYYRFNSDNADVFCTITKDNVIEGPRMRATGSDVDPQDRRESFAGTRGFVEDTSGTFTYNLVCSPEDASDDVEVFSAVLTAIYAPNNIEVTP